MWTRPMEAPRPSDGLVHAHESAVTQQAGGERLAVDAEIADAILDLRHEHNAVLDRFGVDPVGDQWATSAPPSPTSSTSLSRRSAASSALAVMMTAQCPLSAAESEARY